MTADETLNELLVQVLHLSKYQVNKLQIWI